MANSIATFENTVGILVKAFLDGTLLKGDCRACAVGNICAAAHGTKVIIHNPSSPILERHARWDHNGVAASPLWDSLFVTFGGEQHKRWLAKDFDASMYRMSFAQVAATGYQVQDLARIEFAFENASKEYSEEGQFAGLMAVVDVLADIHGIDLTTATAAKALFVRA